MVGCPLWRNKCLSWINPCNYLIKFVSGFPSFVGRRVILVSLGNTLDAESWWLCFWKSMRREVLCSCQSCGQEGYRDEFKETFNKVIGRRCLFIKNASESCLCLLEKNLQHPGRIIDWFNRHIYSINYIVDVILNALQKLTYLICIIITWGRFCYHLHFKDKEALGAQSIEYYCSITQLVMAELGLESGWSGSRLQAQPTKLCFLQDTRGATCESHWQPAIESL